MTRRPRMQPDVPPVSSLSYMLLRDLVQSPMPRFARGALLRRVPPNPSQPIQTVWVSNLESRRLSPGSILLSWEPSSGSGMDVTAHLCLASVEVLLARWPALHGDWIPVVYPTLHEVIGLHSALSVATAALQLANDLAAN